jgi:ABC-2 type transport system ATP-binding protein
VSAVGGVGAPGSPGPVIEVDGVSKWFKDLVALSDVTVTIGPGVTALLGPNGAGKSTLLRVVCGLTAPSRGAVRVLGQVPRHQPELWRSMGLVPQQESLPDALTARWFVTAAARLQGTPDPERAAAAHLELVELDPGDRRPLKAYSKGMRQRVKVAAALVHQPPVVILDEPLNGLDPAQRVRMIELLQRLGDQGRCVLVSSHVLEEVERFGSRIVVIAEGRLAAVGPFREIRELMDDRPHRLRLRTDRPRELAAALVGAGVASGVSVGPPPEGAGRGPGVVVVDTPEVVAFRRAVAALAQREQARLYELAPLDDDLDSVFRYLVERRSR